MFLKENLSCKPLAGADRPNIIFVVLIVVVHVAVVIIHDPDVALIPGNLCLHTYCLVTEALQDRILAVLLFVFLYRFKVA